MVKSIHRNHPALFDLPEEDEESEQGTTESFESGNQSALSAFGIIPFVLTYCQLTNETLTAAMRESVLQVLYIYNYEHIRRLADEENRRRYSVGGFGGMR